MSDSQDVLAKSIIDEFLELTGAARIAHLDRACAGDPDLRGRVDALLAAINVNDGFLSAPSASIESASEPVSDERPGAWIGPYRLVELLGEGGFGSVFLAEQSSPLARRVAIKLIKPGMDTRQVLARFEAERRALALMDHPNIARVFDAGATARGRPYFVMELVGGDPVTEYCDRRNLSIVQRVRLFREVCGAVQHAHQKGVIHRDLKPSNVLVTECDGTAVPKVIDFGIAKLTATRITGATLVTELHQLIGTPEYMSPEQADLSNADVDTRSDVYALGVLLYELLTGGTPFDAARLRAAPFEELQRVIRVELPLRPSHRIAATSSQASRLKTPQHARRTTGADPIADAPIADVARHRATEPLLLSRTIRGDLDWIAMKCLEKDRARRYQTVAALADDLDRYLAHQPVSATPPSRGYLLRKFVQRHRAAVLAGTAVLLALTIGLGAALYGLRAARLERDAANLAREGETRHRRSAERVADFMENMLAGADPEIAAGRDTALLRSFLDGAVRRIEQGELADAPHAEASLRITISNIYRTLGDAMRAASMLTPLNSALAEAVRADPRLWERFLEVQAMALSAQSLFDAASVRLHELAAVRREQYGPHDRRVAWVLATIADNLISQQRYQESLAPLQEALEIAEASGDDATLANVLTNLAEPLGRLGQHQKATESAERALLHSRKAFPGDHPHVADAMNNLAAALLGLPGEADRMLALLRESVEMKRRLYPDGHPHLGVSMHNLALALQQRGDLAAAEQFYTEALSMLRRYSPVRDDDVALTLLNLCGLTGKLGQHERREALAREALTICRRLYPDGHEYTSFALIHIATSLRDRGRSDESLEFFSQAIDIQRRLFHPVDPRLANSLTATGAVLTALRRFDDALPLLREALSIRESQRDSDPASYALSLIETAIALIESGTLPPVREAESMARQGLEIRRRIMEPDDWRLWNTESILGGAIAARAELDAAATMDDRLSAIREAESLLTASFAQLEAHPDRIPALHRSRALADAARRLVRLYTTWNALDPAAKKDPTADAWRARWTELSAGSSQTP